MRVVDKNTVYIENGTPYNNVNGTTYPNKSYFTNTYRYIPYDKTQLTITNVNPPSFDYFFPAVEVSLTTGAEEVVTYNNATWYDENQCVWFGSTPGKFYGEFFYGGGNNGILVDATKLTICVDMARAFLAVNGNVGSVPPVDLVWGTNADGEWYVKEDGSIEYRTSDLTN